MSRIIKQFPHCDPCVLHAPGECKYCDKHPEWQELRQSWDINFTGKSGDHDPYSKWLPCPSDYNRGLAGAHMWPGNQPRPKNEVTMEVFGDGPKTTSPTPPQTEGERSVLRHIANANLERSAVLALEDKPDAWKEYTLHELAMWVRLLSKRSGHRTDKAKADKDKKDADNYKAMFLARTDAFIKGLVND